MVLGAFPFHRAYSHILCLFTYIWLNLKLFCCYDYIYGYYVLIDITRNYVYHATDTSLPLKIFNPVRVNGGNNSDSLKVAKCLVMAASPVVMATPPFVMIVLPLMEPDIRVR